VTKLLFAILSHTALSSYNFLRTPHCPCQCRNNMTVLLLRVTYQWLRKKEKQRWSCPRVELSTTPWRRMGEWMSGPGKNLGLLCVYPMWRVSVVTNRDSWDTTAYNSYNRRTIYGKRATMHFQHTKDTHSTRCIQQFFAAAGTCLRSRCLATHTDRLIGGIYETRRWDRLRCHDIRLVRALEHWYGGGIYTDSKGGLTGLFLFLK
jgi:hypothetical protein